MEFRRSIYINLLDLHWNHAHFGGVKWSNKLVLAVGWPMLTPPRQLFGTTCLVSRPWGPGSSNSSVKSSTFGLWSDHFNNFPESHEPNFPTWLRATGWEFTPMIFLPQTTSKNYETWSLSMLVVKTPAMSKCVLYSARGRMQLKSFFLGHLAVPLFSRALPKNLCLVDWVVPPEFSITGSGEGNIWRKPWKKIDVYHILSYFIIFYHHGQRFPPNFPLASTSCRIWGTAIVRKLSCSCAQCTAATEFEKPRVKHGMKLLRFLKYFSHHEEWFQHHLRWKNLWHAACAQPRRPMPSQIFSVVKISSDLFSVIKQLQSFLIKRFGATWHKWWKNVEDFELKTAAELFERCCWPLFCYGARHDLGVCWLLDPLLPPDIRVAWALCEKSPMGILGIGFRNDVPRMMHRAWSMDVGRNSLVRKSPTSTRPKTHAQQKWFMLHQLVTICSSATAALAAKTAWARSVSAGSTKNETWTCSEKIQLLAADQFKLFTVQQIGDLPRPAIRSTTPKLCEGRYSHLIVSYSYIFQQKYINPQATAFNHSDFGPIPAFSRYIHIYIYT